MEFELYYWMEAGLVSFRYVRRWSNLPGHRVPILHNKKKKSILFTILFYSDVPILAFWFVPSSFIASG